jgi:hypothetical protein
LDYLVLIQHIFNALDRTHGWSSPVPHASSNHGDGDGDVCMVDTSDFVMVEDEKKKPSSST